MNQKIKSSLALFILIAILASINSLVSPADSDKVENLEIADSYLREIADGQRIRNEANAPLAQSISQVFSGEISQSEFIGKYPSQLNAAQEAANQVDEVCARKPTINLDAENTEDLAAEAMLKLAEGFCDSEMLKWKYLMKAIEAGATLDESTFNQAIDLFDDYSNFVYRMLDEFIQDPSVNKVLPSEQISFFIQMRDSFKI
jgi:hypothetical protein